MHPSWGDDTAGLLLLRMDGRTDGRSAGSGWMLEGERAASAGCEMSLCVRVCVCVWLDSASLVRSSWGEKRGRREAGGSEMLQHFHVISASPPPLFFFLFLCRAWKHLPKMLRWRLRNEQLQEASHLAQGADAVGCTAPCWSHLHGFLLASSPAVS